MSIQEVTLAAKRMSPRAPFVSTFHSAIRRFVESLRASPEILRTNRSDHEEIKKKLHSQGDEKSQGTGNAVTDQETCFAVALEQNGFQYSSDRAPLSSGNYYIYQVNGSQRSIDFQAFEWVSGAKTREVNFDLKHTKSENFFLNDGWFHTDIVYIVSWMRKISEPRKKKVSVADTFIGLGQDIPTENETRQYNFHRELLKQMNMKKDDEPSNLVLYTRSANQYKCASRFTSEFSETCFTNVLAFLSNA